jgi:hypothetical protein
MCSVRPGPIFLATAALFAVTHAAGVLFATPVWRFAELASLGALLAYAVLRGLPEPRWALPAALAALFVDAVRTLPPVPSASEFSWQILTPAEGIEMTSGVEAAFAAWWAPLVAVVLLLIAWHQGHLPSRVATTVAAVAAVLITGYAAIRVIGIGLAVRGSHTPHPGRVDAAETMTAATLAVLPAVALGLAAVALTAVLARTRRRLAAAGASLLAVVALPHIDSGIEAAALPYSASIYTGLFGTDLLTPTLVMPQPLSAMTTALEMAAFLLLVAGNAGPRLQRRD